MSDILFSIIIPTYNRANMLTKAIESVLAQTYDNWELIIIDDGSTDNTKEVISSYKSNKIIYIYQKNQKESVARNKGIDTAKGDYICFLDDDDYYLDSFLIKFYNKIKKDKHDNTIYMCEQLEKNGDKFVKVKLDKKKLNKNHIKYLTLNSNNLQPFVIPAKILKSEKFEPKFEFGEDFHLLMRLLFKSKLKVIPETLCVYRFHKNSTFYTELYNGGYIKKNNRLDTFDDLILRYKKELISHKAYRSMTNKYNQYVYFYSSSALRNNSLKYSINTLKKIKWDNFNVISLYYFFSVIFRIPYYFFKENFKNYYFF